MKLLKISAIALMSLAGANAATITVTAGFGAQGLNVTTSGVAATSFHVAIGSWDGSSFTQFATGIQDTAKVNGVFTATVPPAVNSQVIHLFVGQGSSVDFGGNYVLFRTNTNTAFPADVSSGSATATFSATALSGLTAVSQNNATLTSGTNTINFVPEPSVALLGALGVFGLIRRRR